ncbi:flavodoxin [Enterococcus hulanensis]|uniref:flavodoxin n=1 Tax=Enterococcus hulanensis TaxID=2559929 RepID=UPI00288DF80A|nr:flavodoxin [Enterococcus hulanensis]MDT2661919.1 flavodoxin [Enterococcus hulanensis]
MQAGIIFFSRAGENYINGKKQVVSIGNTEILAQKISEQTQLPVYSLRPLEPYSMNYDEAVQKAEKEKQTLAKVGYEELAADIEQMETIFLGFPNWWGTYPRIVATFLEQQDWKNKTLYPFCTHEGSAFGSSIQDLHNHCPDAEIKKGLAVRGSKVDRADTAVKNWLLSYQNNH